MNPFCAAGVVTNDAGLNMFIPPRKVLKRIFNFPNNPSLILLSTILMMPIVLFANFLT